MMRPEGRGPIFVVGCPRSGTTMLQVMLNRHPRIAIPPETRFLMRAYDRRVRFGDLELRENRAKVARFIVDRGDTWFPDLELDGDAVKRAIVDGPPTIGSAFATVLRAYAERFDKPRWGDKRPGYHRQIEVLLRLFPGAQIVHIVRDPRDCVTSLKQMSWWHHRSARAMAVWAQAIDNVDAARRRWPEAIIEVQYEKLVADPEPELRALCAALGEEYAPAMLSTREQAAIPERKHWHAYAHLAPTTERIGRWREHLSPAELALLETVLRRRMARFGYRPTGRPRAKPRQILGYRRVRREVNASVERERARERSRREREPNPVAAVLPTSESHAATSERPAAAGG